MKIPFADLPFGDLLNKAKSLFVRPSKNSGPLPMPERPDKPESDKFAKTVTPNAVQTLTTQSSPESLMSAPTPRIVSAGRGNSSALRDLPPAVALALEPRVERVLSVGLTDLIAHVPSGYLKPSASFDVSRRVLLKAAEVEKGMAMGRPTIGINAIYQQMPEIFMHVVPAGDLTLVAVPFEKLLSELSQRDDQATEQIAQQFETPFLQVTMEDTKKFGITMEPVNIAQMPELSSARMQMATAETLAAAAPETKLPRFAQSGPTTMAKGAQPISLQTNAPAPIAFAPSPQKNGTPAKPESKPISLSPLQPPAPPLKFGTGEPAIPRVPASSGPPVPEAPPLRIPFEVPGAEKPAPVPEGLGTLPLDGAAPLSPGAPAAPQVTLPLRAILQSLPPLQLKGDPASVPAEARISFQFSQIASQLTTGKVAIPPKDFHAALPAEYRSLFLPDAVEAAVPLSLPDVLANLPGNALQMRGDQETLTPDEVFETPFSQKADEDAKRFEQTPAAKKEPPKVEEAKVPEIIPQAPERVIAEQAKPAPPKKTEFDAKAAVAQASALPGVTSCAVTFVDGLSVAGNIPPQLGLDGLSAVAPTLLQKLAKHMLETKLGALTGLTVHGENSPATFFSAGNICLTAVHDADGLSSHTQRELASMTRKLSETYAQPETEHVDH